MDELNAPPWFQDWLSRLNRAGFAFRDLIGEDRWETTWTPARTGWTDVGGAPTVTARFRQFGRSCDLQVKVTPVTSTATVAGTSYITLPIAARGLSGIGNMVNTATNVAVGACTIDVPNSRLYVPAQAANIGPFAIYARWEI